MTACLFWQLQEAHKKTTIPHFQKLKGKPAQRHQVRNQFNYCLTLNDFIKLCET